MTSSVHNIDTQVVSIKVAPVDGAGKGVVELPWVYVKENMNISAENIAKHCDIDTFAHLREIQLPQIDKSSVHLLIGQDQPEVMVPLEVKRGKMGEPYAVKTVLGWAINGPLGGTQNSSTGNTIQTHFTQVQYRSRKMDRPY